MFGIFRKKETEIINPYTLPNIAGEYYCKNIVELYNNMKVIDEDMNKIYYVNFQRSTKNRHEYFVTYDGSLIDDIKTLLKDIHELHTRLSKKYKMTKKTTDNIDALTRINYVLSDVKKSLGDVIK